MSHFTDAGTCSPADICTPTGIAVDNGTFGITTSLNLPFLTEKTLCAWAKLSTNARIRASQALTIFSYGGDDGDHQNVISLGLTVSAINSSGSVIVQVDGRETSTNINESTFETFYNNWHSICFSKGPRNETQLFIDGNVMPHSSPVAHVSTNNTYLAVGAHPFINTSGSIMAKTDTHFSGVIGAVNIWDTESDQVSITEKMSCESRGNVYHLNVSDLTRVGNQNWTEVTDVCTQGKGSCTQSI